MSRREGRRPVHVLRPKYVTPRLRDPQGPPGSRVRCNKQKSLIYASIGSVPLTPAAWRKRERISPSPGVLLRSVVMSLPRLTLIGWVRARDNSTLQGGVGSSSSPRPSLSFPPCLMCLVKSLTQPTSFQHKQQIQLPRPLVPQFPSVLSSLKSSSPPADISSPPGL